MAWRLARSLEVLADEVRTLHPGTTVWTIGDEAHQDTWSDHNPNAAGVVCASDTLGDAGLDLHWYSRRVVASRHPALKYVIYNRQIWSRSRASEGWRTYTGSNPHTGHCHVSVGEGPDGRSTGPYDDTSPWGLLEEDMPLDRTDVNLLWNADGIVKAPDGYDSDNTHWAPSNIIRSAQYHARKTLHEGRERTALLQAVLAAVKGDDTLAAVKAELARHDQAVATRLAEIAALVGTVGTVPADQIVDEIARRLEA